jgi:hypothetical protein
VEGYLCGSEASVGRGSPSSVAQLNTRTTGAGQHLTAGQPSLSSLAQGHFNLLKYFLFQPKYLKRLRFA